MNPHRNRTEDESPAHEAPRLTQRAHQIVWILGVREFGDAGQPHSLGEMLFRGTWSGELTMSIREEV